ncbi:39S ribosomal protein L23, mitochondrial-like [Dreissena polymorpha]|uniref:Large ribosomal subunit protein uL23m n=1 Tax=Dreissena polymorpha TaxID=45954 RepID=A0A9D4HT90_DREPO|nr:39S ribosomal protein L23, mitochondrial-like [Dreissena polymorpha]KAH3728668.1 hypothetical protein DPMN_054627 [Dreissena polymorpha]
MTRLGFLERIPLWQRTIPKYPLHFKGDPQLRVYLPLFWMKMVQPANKFPKNIVLFKVHPQMSKLDIAQYLEKIYETPVANVRTEIREQQIMAPWWNRSKKQWVGRKVVTRIPEKYAYVTLAKDEFVYPTPKKTEKSSDSERYKKYMKIREGHYKELNEALSVPAWFRR